MKKSQLIIFVFTLLFFFYNADAQVSVGISISARIAPPAIPVYVQPACPADGYLWTPGYWAYGDGGYFWVPGVWVRPPQPGYLWTPCYWGYEGGVYGYHAGYWGTHVGFYGGVNYGYGYGGSGFYGGRWEGGAFRYNTAVVNVNRTVVHNTYIDRTVIRNTTVINNRTSYNGGPGGLSARPSAQEASVMHERHIEATSEQQSHQQHAGSDRGQFATVNNGRPNNAAMNRVGGQRFSPEGHNNPATGVPHANGVQQGNMNQRPAAGQHTGMNEATRASQHAAITNARPQSGNHVQQPHAMNMHPAPAARQAPHMQEHAPAEHHEGGGGHEPHHR